MGYNVLVDLEDSLKTYTIEQIASAMGGALIAGSGSLTVCRVCRDSREASPDALFFAMKGQVHDGHDFIAQAAENGCRCFVVNREAGDIQGLPEGGAVIRVPDTAEAFVALAVAALREMKAVIVGITGSVGKTTTKDMVDAVLSMGYRMGKTQGNLNTAIGIAQCILEFPEDVQVAVLEMGTDHPGEIAEVVKYFPPHISVLTNVGQAHLENFGSREGIFRAKMEIAAPLGEGDALVFLEGPDFLRKENLRVSCRLVGVGTASHNDYVLSDMEACGEGGVCCLLTRGGGAPPVALDLPVPGRHNCLNAGLAVAVGELLDIPAETAARGLSEFRLTPGRMELIQIPEPRRLTLLNDTYNASPDSMKAGLRSLMEMTGGRHVAVLGDMLELGPDTLDFHREVGAYAREAGVDLILCAGPLSAALAEGAGDRAVYFPERDSLIAALPGLLEPGDAVLVKASRGMGLEQAVQAILDYKEID